MHRGEPVAGGVRCRSLIVGLGATGLSCARFLCARGDEVTVVDNRETPPQLAALEREQLPITIKLGLFDHSLLEQADQLIVSPGIALDEPLVQTAIDLGLRVTGDIDLFCMAATAPVIAITGSNGKSTVTTMVARMLEASGKTVRAGGNLGPPALDLLADGDEPDAKLDAKLDAYVLELSSFQLERTRALSAEIACVLNVAADHLDRHETLDDYALAKARIYQRCKHAVVNREDSIASRTYVDVDTVSFGLDAPVTDQFGLIGAQLNDDDCWLAVGNEKLMTVGEMAMPGRHNVANALAALAIVRAFGVKDYAAALDVLRNFVGLPHRCQLVADKDGVRWIDDSKGTNVAATVAAVHGLQGPLILIAGGIAKDSDFGLLADALSGKTRAVILLGKDAEKLAASIGDVADTHRAADMAEAVSIAKAVSRRGDSVLLSPACSSYDMFRDFAERGNAFASAVRDQVS